MKLTYEKLEAEIWAARKRFKKDKDFIPFIAGWIWGLINDYGGRGNDGEADLS